MKILLLVAVVLMAGLGAGKFLSAWLYNMDKGITNLKLIM